jgi:hypothetical protein
LTSKTLARLSHVKSLQLTTTAPEIFFIVFTVHQSFWLLHNIL